MEILSKDWFVFLSIALLSFSLGYPMLQSPIFCDEGYFLTISQGLLHGKELYIDLRDNKPPGLYLFLLPITVLAGDSIPLLRVFAFTIIALTAFLVYLIGKRLFDFRIGFVAGILYVTLSMNGYFMSYALMSETISSLFLTGSIYMFLNSSGKHRDSLFAGLLLGIACSIRQTSFICLFPLALLFTAEKKRDFRKLAYLSVGFVLVMALMLAYLFQNNLLSFFIQSAFLTPASKSGYSLPFPSFFDFLHYSLPVLPFLVAGLFKHSKKQVALFGWLLVALASTQLVFSALHHYITVLPALSLFASVGLFEVIGYSRIKTGIHKSIAIGLVVFFLSLHLAFLAMIIQSNIQYSHQSPNPPLFEFYDNTYENQLAISNYIKENVGQNEKLFVFSRDSSLYYLSDRFPVTQAVPFIAVMEKNQMGFQALILDPLKKNRPEKIIVGDIFVDTLRDLGTSRDNTLALEQYINENYELVGEIPGTNYSVYALR